MKISIPPAQGTLPGMANNVKLDRLRGITALAVVGAASLPASAMAVEAISDRAENWILPTQLAGMGALGALAGAALPGMAGAHAGRWKGAGAGAAVGLASAIAWDAVWLMGLGIGG